MDNIARLLPMERSQIISETAALMGTTPAIVEKDFWVCWVLEKYFDHQTSEVICCLKEARAYQRYIK